jgi:hypothetical protein
MAFPAFDYGAKAGQSSVTYITFVFFADLYHFQWLEGPAANSAAFNPRFRRKETAWAFIISPAPPTAR